MSDFFINIPNSGSPSWKRPVDDAADLPLTGNTSGDARITLNDDSIYVWNGTAWVQVSTPAVTSAITALLGDVSAVGPGAVSATVNFVGGVSAANVASGANSANAATSSNTPNTIVKRDGSGNFSAGTITASLTGNVLGNLTGNVTGNVSGSSASFTGSLAGDVTGTQGATSISSPTVTGKLLTGFVSGPNSPVLATDSILIGFDKLQAQVSSTSGSAITALTGDATATGPGSVALTLATVNGNVGSFGSSTSIPNFTVNAKGLITAAGSNVVIAPAGTLTGTTLAPNVVNSSLTSVGTLTSLTLGTPLAVSSGGTGSSAFTAGSVIFSNGTTLAQDNAKFFWDDTNFRLGIGLNTPTESLHLSANTTNRLFVDAYGTGSVPVIASRMARGTFASPTATQTDDLLMDLSGRGYTGAAFSTGKGTFFVRAAENWSATANGTYITVSTTPVTTTTLTERVRINNTGNVLINTTTDNTDRLQVNGRATVAQAFKLTPFALTDAANIATDASLSNNFTVTLAGNRTLSAPTNPSDKQKVVWEFKQDATGGRTLTFNAIFNFGIFPTLVLSGGPNKKDYMGAIYDSVTSTWDVVAYSVGF